MHEHETPDVLPEWGNQSLILLWLSLFGGRWLLAPALQLAGLLSAPQLAELDENVLLKLYLVLLAITVLVLALRAVRSAQSGTMAAVSPAGDGVPDDAGPATMAPAARFDLGANGQSVNTNTGEEMPPLDGQAATGTAGGDENP